MLRYTIISTAWILATVSALFSQTKISAKKIPAEAVLRTSVPVKIDSDATNCKVSGGAGVKVFAREASSNKFREMKFALVPEADGDAVLELRAGEGKKPLAVYFTGIKGAAGFDFKDGLGGWKPTGRVAIVPNPVESGGGMCAETTRSKRISHKIRLVKGVRTEFSARVSCGDGWEDSFCVDLSKAANSDFKAGAGDGVLPAFSKLKAPKLGRVYGGMKFKILNADRNEGASAVVITRKGDSAKVDFSGALPRGKYLYVLHTAGGDANGNLGRITVKFADGRDKKLLVACKTDIWRATENPAAFDNALPVFVNDKKSKTGVLYMSRFDLVGGDGLADIASVGFELLRSAHWEIVAATVSSREVNTTENLKFDPAVWKPLDIDTFAIEKGSALDMSESVARGAPAGKYGRVKIGKNGGFVFEDRPDEEIRFKSANFFELICGFGWNINTHEEIDKYVAELKKQGYNAIRWRFAMKGKGEFEAPYKLKPLNRDLYDYFLHALGREGIYSFFYICSHDTGDPSFTWNDRFTVKVKMMLGDPAVREAWRKLAKMQLEHVNPYTGKAWKDDPSIAAIEYWNEFELGIAVYNAITEEGRKLVNAKFAEYLSKRFKSVSEFLAYCDGIGKPWTYNGAFDKFEQVDVSPHPNRSGNPVFTQFLIGAMEDMQAFCENVVRGEIGMKIPTHQNNCLKNVFWTYLSSEGGSYTAVNTYHAHPSSYSLGADVYQNSSIGNAGGYWRGTVVKRVSGMPIAVTEFQHCYFNKYAHEAGVLFPAYSALQGYNALVAFDSPVAFAPRRLSFFGIGVNPVFRANDFLTNFLFKRGDVKRSPHRIDVVYGREFFEKSPNVAYAVNDQQSRISLMTGFALSFPDGRKLEEIKAVEVKSPDMAMSPVGASAVEVAMNFAEVGKTIGADFKTADIVGDFKKRGILPADNISDPANEIYQSDTGEILMDVKKRRLTVSTPKSQAAVLNAGEGANLGDFNVKSCGADASVAVVSIDGKPIRGSSRMVLVFATDTVTSGVGLSSSRRKINAWGKPPILVQTAKLSAELKLDASKKFDFFRLKMNGARAEKIPFEIENGVMKIELDTSEHVGLFFEIVERAK